MGLFTKHKKEEDLVAPPVNSPIPPMPEIQTVENGASLNNSEEQLPSLGLDDIKSQVISDENSQIETPIQDNSNQIEKIEENNSELDPNLDLNIDDSLFNFSDEEVLSNETDNSSKLLETDSNTINEMDSNEKNLSKLNFLNNSSHYNDAKKNENYFVTTSQFKTLLEIVDSVKLRIKNSTDSHLRLLDIKSEEDIEYENLRKDFQFVEDKLYELDGIIFEK